MAGIDRRLDLIGHLGGRDQRLIVEMSATLGKTLIFDLDRLRARLLKQTHRAIDSERVAVAGIGIDNEIGVDAVADQRDRINDFGETDQANVRPSQPRIGDGSTRYIERVKTGLRCDQCSERIVNTGGYHNRRLRQAQVQSVLLGHGYNPRKARLRLASERMSAALPDMTKLPCSRM